VHRTGNAELMPIGGRCRRRAGDGTSLSALSNAVNPAVADARVTDQMAWLSDVVLRVRCVTGVPNEVPDRRLTAPAGAIGSCCHERCRGHTRVTLATDVRRSAGVTANAVLDDLVGPLRRRALQHGEAFVLEVVVRSEEVLDLVE
jgi:hypothetical protein